MNTSTRVLILLQFTALLLTVISATSDNNEHDEWHYKFSFTKSVNSQLVIECDESDQIWIGWSHYGTRNPSSLSSASTSQPTAAALSSSSSSDYSIGDGSVKNSQNLNL